MEIRCKKDNCEHNTGCSCKAGSIAVDKGGHHCCSYIDNPLKSNLIEENGDIFSVAEEKVHRHIRSVPLACNEKTCLFNKEERCQANGVTVIDDGKKACCATYCPR